MHSPNSTTITADQFIDDMDNDLSIESLNISGNNAVFVKLEKYDLTTLCNHVLNVNNVNDAFVIQKEAPFNPPCKKGKYFCIVDAEYVDDIGDVLNDDRLAPWNMGKKKAHYYPVGMYLKSNGYKAKNNETTDADKELRMLHANHPIYEGVSKRVISATTKNNQRPENGTFIVFYYDVKNDYNLPPVKDKRRLQPSTSAQIRPLLKTNTPLNALEKHSESGAFMGNTRGRLPTKSQVEGLARTMNAKEERGPISNKGRPRNESHEKIQTLLSMDYFVRACYISGGDEERYFLANDASIFLFKKSMLSPTIVNTLITDANKLLNYGDNVKFEEAKRLISSPQFAESDRTGICYIDTTFKISRLELTIILFSCKHILNKDNDPSFFIACMMLSKRRTYEDYLWLASQFFSRLGNFKNIARGLLTDGDHALDAFQTIKLFSPPCIRLTCGEHLKRNISYFCDGNKKVMADIFGGIQGTVKSHGLFDEFKLEEFKKKLAVLASTDEWLKHEELQKWATSVSRHENHFHRYNLKQRIAAGFGFNEATTNALEGLNMLIKSEIKRKHALQDAMLYLQEFVDRQLLQAGMSLVSTYPYKLKNQREFVGQNQCANLTVDEKRQRLETIGLTDTDKIPGFTIKPIDFPHELAPKLSADQRMDFVTKAKTYTVMEVPNERGCYIVTKGAETFKINIREMPIKCSCSLMGDDKLICYHILAINEKFPLLQIYEKLKEYVQHEQPDERLKRKQKSTDGAKPTSSRRHGSSFSRNNKRQIMDVVDLTNDYEPSDSEASQTSSLSTYSRPSSQAKIRRTDFDDDVFERPLSQSIASRSSSLNVSERIPRIPVLYHRAPSQTSSTSSLYPNLPPPLSQTSSISNLYPQLPRPLSQAASASRLYPSAPTLSQASSISSLAQMHHVPISSQQSQVNRGSQKITAKDDNQNVKQAVLAYYRQNVNEKMPSFVNFKPFEIIMLKKVTDYKNGKCVTCDQKLGAEANAKDKFVITHFEMYEFYNVQTKLMTKSTGVRTICANMVCLNSRYPYVNRLCFIGDLAEDVKNALIDEVVRE